FSNRLTCSRISASISADGSTLWNAISSGMSMVTSVAENGCSRRLRRHHELGHDVGAATVAQRKRERRIEQRIVQLRFAGIGKDERIHPAIARGIGNLIDLGRGAIAAGHRTEALQQLLLRAGLQRLE